MGDNKEVRMAVFLAPDLKEAFEAYARRRGRTMARQAEWLIKEALAADEQRQQQEGNRDA